MQNPEGGSDSAASVALHPSASAQAPVVQAVPASQQRVLVQATGSAPKGAQMQQISVPRVQQVPQQVQSVQHVYPAQVQYVEGGEAVYTNGTIRAAYSYSSEAQIYAPASAAPYFEAQGGGGGGGAQLEMAIENLQKNEGITSHKSSLLNSHGHLPPEQGAQSSAQPSLGCSRNTQSSVQPSLGCSRNTQSSVPHSLGCSRDAQSSAQPSLGCSRNTQSSAQPSLGCSEFCSTQP